MQGQRLLSPVTSQLIAAHDLGGVSSHELVAVRRRLPFAQLHDVKGPSCSISVDGSTLNTA